MCVRFADSSSKADMMSKCLISLSASHQTAWSTCPATSVHNQRDAAFQTEAGKPNEGPWPQPRSMVSTQWGQLRFQGGTMGPCVCSCSLATLSRTTTGSQDNAETP
jgi:hypothetical protein